MSAIALELVVAGLGIGVGEKQKVVDAVELLAVDLGGGGQFEHPLERDRRLLAGVGALADEAGPHGVVEFGSGWLDILLVLAVVSRLK